MRADVTVHTDSAVELMNGLEETLVVAIVDAVHEVPQVRESGHD